MKTQNEFWQSTPAEQLAYLKGVEVKAQLVVVRSNNAHGEPFITGYRAKAGVVLLMGIFETEAYAIEQGRAMVDEYCAELRTQIEQVA